MDYHSQEGATVPRLTYSTAKVLLEKSPLHAWYQHPLLGNNRRIATKAMDTGSVCHDLMLGGGQEIIILPFNDYRKKEAQAAKQTAYDNDCIPMLEKDYQECKKITDSATEQLKDLLPEFFTPHENEYPIIWTAENEVECQSKWDWLQLETGLQIDLKFTNDASPDKCIKNIINL